MAMENNEKKGRRWGLIIGLFVALFVFSLFMSLMIKAFSDFDDDNGVGFGNVAIIRIYGPILTTDGGLLSGEVTKSDDILKFIKKANESDEIKAVVFEINSPGGSAVASDEIGRAIKEMNKTTVAWIREVGASGGYWIASSTDHIIANRMSITGSIGVIGSYLEFSGLLNRYNVTYQRMVSGKYKDMGSPFKELSDE